MNSIATFRSRYNTAGKWLTHWLSPISQLFLRLAPVQVFMSSGLSKWNGWFDFDEQKYDLFLYEFFCPDPIRPNALLLCNPNTLDYEQGSATVKVIELLAVTAGVMEVLLPLLLLVGFFTRFAALGLITMTLFIQLAVFPEWGHWWNPAMWWFVSLFAVFVSGPGKLSLDYWLRLDRPGKELGTL